MMNFIKKLINDVLENIENGSFGDNCNLSDIAFVFPTRRAGLYLRKYLLEKEPHRAQWSPDLFSILDFIQEVTKKNFPDQLTLIFELYKTYRKTLNNEKKSFDKFYPWGKIILSDFNDIDQNLIDPGIFTELREFSDTNIDGANILRTYNNFMQDIQELYFNFKDNLGSNHSTYYGLAIRELVLSLRSSNFDPFSRWRKIVFAGFNFLTKGEEELLSILEELDKGIYYWDIDEYFYSDKDNEAGTFFRSSKLINNNSKWIDKELILSKKIINIIGTPGKIGQTKVMANLLEKFPKENKDANISDKTSIILSDESLLFPVLNSIPKSIKDINVSMGSPIKNSPPYNFIFLILNIIVEQQNHEEYLFEDVKKILLHPYLFINFQTGIKEFISEYTKSKTIYLTLEDFTKLGDDLYKIFNYKNDNELGVLFQYIENLVLFLKKTLIRDSNKVELEYLFAFYNQFKRIRDLFLKYKPDIELKQCLKILKDSLENTIVPFSGEPLKGLQILGMLETRAIDFENVYILSVNEGIFPKGKTAQTLIPNEIRKQHGMSYFEKRDAIFAYYFYRIIKGAGNITILYNTESDDFSKGEKSRFIEQLNHEFEKINIRSTISEQIITIDSDFSIPSQINIEKSEKIINALKGLSYSASSINKYLNCSLSFYFRYILKLKEQEIPDTAMDAKSFGTFIHEILEYIYKPYLNKELNKQDIDLLQKSLNTIIEKHFKNNLKINNTKSGKNYINKIIINKLLVKFFTNESSQLPIRILGLEKKLTRNLELLNGKGNTIVKIYGTIDRIDKHDDFLRIIDYKTGKLNSLKNTINLDSPSSDILEQIKSNKEVLQLMVYNYLINGDKDLKRYKNIKYGITFFKSLSKGTIYLDNSNSAKDLNKKSELVISTIISEILDKNTSFSQTENKDNCKHCAYKDICYR